MPRQAVNPPQLRPPAAAFSHAIRSGELLFLAGQCGLDGAGRVVDPGVAAQTRRAIENLSIVLEAAGFALSDVVYVTTFLIDLADFDAYDAAYAEAFGDHRPARATVRADLHGAGLRVEIQAIAHKPS
jgi:2-iminobutanoate/2-iminopropanoate deaminase